MLLNSSAVHLKWKPPPQPALNGVLISYQVIQHIKFVFMLVLKYSINNEGHKGLKFVYNVNELGSSIVKILTSLNYTLTDKLRDVSLNTYF